MSNLWLSSLQTLRRRFGHPHASMYHLFVEVREGEREYLQGPEWFTRQQPRMMGGGGGEEGTWTCFAHATLPAQSPSFRAFTERDALTLEREKDFDQRVIRDKSGRPRAVFEPQVIRIGHFAGDHGAYKDFIAMAAACSQALLGIPDAALTKLPPDVAELCRPGASLRQHVFGTVHSPPKPVPSGWNALIYQEEDGVLILSPEPYFSRDAGAWLLILHRLGWRRVPGSALSARRYWWDGNFSIGYADVEAFNEGQQADEFLRQQLDGRKTRHFFSVLGTQEAPLDVHVASASAIDILIEQMSDGTPGDGLARGE